MERIDISKVIPKNQLTIEFPLDIFGCINWNNRKCKSNSVECQFFRECNGKGKEPLFTELDGEIIGVSY